MAELALQGVSKTYSGRIVAVEDLNLTVRDREFVALVGPSGCGKTTTLRLVAGLEELTRGVIRIGGRPVTQVPPRDRNIAMVFQHSALYPHLTVSENIAFGLRLRTAPCWTRRWACRGRLGGTRLWSQQRALHRAVLRASRRLGLEGLLERKPHELSGGERQRVALARAIARRPAVFLLDEPLSHLDAQQRAEMRAVIRRVHQQLGATMVYVTHDQAEAMVLADRIAVMNGGRIQQIGTCREVYERPATQFVARFVGEPTMNLIAGRLELRPQEAGAQRCVFLGGGLVIDVNHLADDRRPPADQDRPVVLGVRPEHVRLVPLAPGGDRQAPGRGRQEQHPERQATGCRWCGTGRVTRESLTGSMTVATVELAGPRTTAGSARDCRHQAGSPAADGSLLQLTVAMPTTEAVGAGRRVAVEIDAADLRLFDLHTGANVEGTATAE